MKSGLNEAPVQPLAVSVQTAAKMLGCGRSSLYKLLNDGALERCSIYRRTLITTASIRRLVEASTSAVEAR